MPDTPSSAVKYYPAFCWPASSTYNAWVKLSAVDVHRLVKRPGSECRHSDTYGHKIASILTSFGGGTVFERVWFLGNHPIRYVRLVGLVIAYVEASEWTELHGPGKLARTQRRPHVFTIDDGSGETLDVVLWTKRSAAAGVAQFPGEMIQLDPLDLKKKAGQSISGETVNLDLVEVGKVVKVKGWIDEFRGKRQMSLERVSLVADTAAEVREWEELAAYQENVLAKPWILTDKQVRKLSQKADRSKQGLREKSKRGRRYEVVAPESFEEPISKQPEASVVDST